MPSPQALYWILTIPHEGFTPYLPPDCCHVIGQLELGEGGFLHWQLVATFNRKATLSAVRTCFGPWHAERTRSDAAREYVWKEDTRVAGTQFEIGQLPIRRNMPTTGQQYEQAQLPEIYPRCPMMYSFVVITNCGELAATAYNQFQWSELVQYSGGEVVLARVVGPGTRQVSKLTLKILEPNGGMVTTIMNVLSSMNSGVPLTFRTSYAGSTGIQFASSVKVPHCHCLPLASGSRPTWTPDCGTPM